MQFIDLQNKLNAVVGFGQEGRATTEYLLKHGVIPVLFDERPWKEWSADHQAYIKSLAVNFIFGPDAFKELKGFNVVFRSPGIKLNQVVNNVSKSTLITSQTKWFFDHCPAKIIGVTGTKGKGTTSSLIYEILQANAYNLKAKSYLTGNIGKVQPFEILDNLKNEDFVVYELSSFQLQDLKKSPHIGVVLMVTSEHLDYHKDLAEYIEGKSGIVKYQTADDFAIINVDYSESVEIGNLGKGKKIFFSTKKELEEGVFVKDKSLVIKNVLGAGFKLPTPVAEPMNRHATGQATGYQLRGNHNLENIEAAITACLAIGIKDPDVLQTSINAFKGLEHRLEFVAEKQSVKYYNDSFSTTPETAIAAINSFTEPIILILGGSSKNSDFTQLGKTIHNSNNIKALILIGQETERIKQSINTTSIKILEGAKSMQEIFEQINSVKAKGDVVLLSPACASFDMFENYKDRGEQFKQAVNAVV